MEDQEPTSTDGAEPTPETATDIIEPGDEATQVEGSGEPSADDVSGDDVASTEATEGESDNELADAPREDESDDDTKSEVHDPEPAENVTPEDVTPEPAAEAEPEAKQAYESDAERADPGTSPEPGVGP